MSCSNNIVICIVLTTNALTYLPLVIHGLPTESNRFKVISRINDNKTAYKSNFDQTRNGFSAEQLNKGHHRFKRQDIPLVETSDFDAAWKKRIVDFHNIFRRRETNAGDMLKMVGVGVRLLHNLFHSSVITYLSLQVCFSNFTHMYMYMYTLNFAHHLNFWKCIKFAFRKTYDICLIASLS